MPTLHAALDPDHIPPPPRRAAGTLGLRPEAARAPCFRVTIAGLGPFQEACVAGMLALALSWGSVELWFLLGEPLVVSPGGIVLAAFGH